MWAVNHCKSVHDGNYVREMNRE